LNLLVCGVGGQGVLLFSDIIARIALASGFDVKKSEVHGMAQRGGSVTSHIRWAKKVYSPLIEEGTADLIVGFEMLEAIRYRYFLSPNGWLIYDPLRIDPLPVKIGLVERLTDEQLANRLRLTTPKNIPVPAFDTACALGNPRVQNTVMLGALSQLLEFPQEIYEDVIKQTVKPSLVAINLKALTAGATLITEHRQ